jgi:hypothetical protein
MFAFLTAHYMRTAAQSARTSARSAWRSAQRAGIPHAMFKKPLTLDEYMARGSSPIRCTCSIA